jgi:NAD(P)-dependent dehydrogenase (short-subunit alcohol dehydrogenase family)
MRLDGRHAVVTGAGRGIGMACAVALAQAGAKVTLVARSDEETSRVAQAIRDEGGQAQAVRLDVTRTADVQEFFSGQSTLDVLVNNAGTNRPKPMDEVTEDDFDTLFKLNVRAAFFASKAFAMRLMQMSRAGSIIQVSSQMGHVGAVNRVIYCATKHAMEGMTKAMALELASHRIRVNTLCPTFVDTPMTHDWLQGEAFRSEVLSKIALGRVGQVEDLMAAVQFLASDASTLMTGSALVLDGGWTAA